LPIPTLRENPPEASMARHPAPPFYRSARPGKGSGRARVSSVDYEGGVSATGTIDIAAGNAADADTVDIDASAVGGPAVTLTFVLETAATGSITTVAGGSLLDTETFTIGDGITSVTFEFDSGGGVTPPNVAVPFTGADSADTVRDSIITAITGSVLAITPAIGGAGLVSLVNNNVGSAGNVPITDSVANVGFVVSGMSGAVGADADDEVAVGSTIDDSATNLAARVNLAANGLTSYLSATPVGGGSGDVTLTAAASLGSTGDGITYSATGANLSPVATTNLAGGGDVPTAAIDNPKPNASVVPLVYTNGIGERTLYQPRQFHMGAPELDLD
jgi:hypothetical protein